MMKVNAAAVEQYHRKAVGLANRARSALAKADQVVDKVVTASVTGVSAFGFGVAKGRQGGGIEVMGVPVDLGAGLAAHALGFIGVAGDKAEYLHAAGNGALASYLTDLGRGVGVEWKRKREAAQVPGGSAPQIPAATSGATISDDDLLRMARGAAPASI